MTHEWGAPCDTQVGEGLNVNMDGRLTSYDT